jgi:hypothetical protein
MPQREVPANAQAMHDRLATLGVVTRVHRILMNRDTTHNVTDLVCWLERDGADLRVKAAYMHHRKHLVSGKPTDSHVDYARFRVAAGSAFGPMGSPALPNELIAKIQAILPA